MKSLKKRKICIISGSRAEYGLLLPLIKRVYKDENLTLQLLITGMHLSKDFGETYKEIEYPILKKIDLKLGNKKTSISKSMGIAQIKLSKTLKNIKPDIVVVLGDRFEIFASTSSAFVLGIPIAHIHGGELTFGAIDDSFRHCITKMSHLHFCSTSEYKNRIIQLGEDSKNIHNVGALGVENIKNLKLLSKKEIEDNLAFKFKKKNLLITFHPETLSSISPKKQIKILLDSLKEQENTLLIFTKSNADFGGYIINKQIDKFVANNENAIVFTSMGQKNYFSTLHFVDAVIGNSSSGIIEIPSFKIPTINIGRRQEGRTSCKSIINCDLNKNSIKKAIIKAYDKSYLKDIKDIQNPYEGKSTSKKIINILKHTKLNDLLNKSFKDIKNG